MAERKRVRFDRPPVVEVICGVLFSTQTSLKAAHVGRYWERVKTDFPHAEDAPPLLPIVEGDPGSTIAVEFGVGVVPPLRRSWLISSDGRSLVQVQQDRFLFNWKKATADDAYPSYDDVISRFDSRLAEFSASMADLGIGSLTYREFELTYVNLISLAESNAPTFSAFNVLIDHVRETSGDRFLPAPQAVNWVSVYALPDEGGRLYVTAQSASLPDGSPALRLDLTARGMPPDWPDTHRRKWFDRAHEIITHGFADITAPEIQTRAWGRTS